MFKVNFQYKYKFTSLILKQAALNVNGKLTFSEWIKRLEASDVSRWVLAPELEGQLWATGHERQGQCGAAEAVDFFRPTLQVYESVERVGRFTAATQKHTEISFHLTQKVSEERMKTSARWTVCITSLLDPAGDELIQKFQIEKSNHAFRGEEFQTSWVALQRLFLPLRARQEVLLFLWKARR